MGTTRQLLLGRAEAHERKRELLLGIAGRNREEGLLLTSPAALSWYLEGARVGVSRAAPPVLAVHVSPHGDELHVFENEADRILEEEVPFDITADLTVRRVPWYDALDASVRDTVVREEAVERAVRDARRSLFPHEIAAYRDLGRDAAAAVTDALSAAGDGMAEQHLAGGIARELEIRGAETLVVLVGGSSRLHHRHPLPTAAPIGRRALVVVCARRRGLVANLSRWVGEAPTAGDLDLEERIARVEAAAFEATQPGAELRTILSRVARAYDEAGLGREEWRRHHQGGPTGYAGRDPRATPATDDTVVPRQAFAWNPTAVGAKVEDTVLLDDRGRLDVLTTDPRWPTRTFAGRDRPTTLTP